MKTDEVWQNIINPAIHTSEKNGELPMTGNLTVFKNKKDKYIADANILLKEAIELNCEAVLIVAVKDDKVIMRHSATLDSVKKLGMIEAAKLEFYAQWK